MTRDFIQKLNSERAMEAYNKIHSERNFALATPYTEIEDYINSQKIKRLVLQTIYNSIITMETVPVYKQKISTKYEKLSNQEFFKLFFNTHFTKDNLNVLLQFCREYINRLCDTYNVPRIFVTFDYHVRPEIASAIAYYDPENGYIALVSKACAQSIADIYTKYNLVHNVQTIDKDLASNFYHFETLIYLTHEFRHYCVFAGLKDKEPTPYYTSLSKARNVFKCADNTNYLFENNLNMLDDCYFEHPDEIDARGFAMLFLLNLEQDGYFKDYNFSCWFHEFYGNVNGKIEYDIKNDAVDLIEDLNESLNSFIDATKCDKVDKQFGYNKNLISPNNMSTLNNLLLMTEEDLKTYYDGLTCYQRTITRRHTTLCKKEIAMERKCIRDWVEEKAKTYDFKKGEKKIALEDDNNMFVDLENKIYPTTLHSSPYASKYEYIANNLQPFEEKDKEENEIAL